MSHVMDEGVTSRKNKSVTCANQLCHVCVTVGVMSPLSDFARVLVWVWVWVGAWAWVWVWMRC